MHKVKIAAGLISIALLGAGVSQAQDFGFRGGPHFGGRGPAGGPGMRGGSENLEGRIAFLKAELLITSSQASQWALYEKYMRDTAAAVDAIKAEIRENRQEIREQVRAAREAGQQPQGGRQAFRKPLLERLADEQDRLEARVKFQQQKYSAITELYKVFSEEQKALAERLL